MTKLKPENTNKYYCEKCGTNPNYLQSDDQQKWESDYIKKHGQCSACDNE